MNVGPIEIVVVLILALLVFGPKRLPQMGKSLGKGIREFRNAAATARTELGLDDVASEISSVKSTVTDLKSTVDLKAAIEAPVPGAPAAASGGEAVQAAVAAGAVVGAADAAASPSAEDAADSPAGPDAADSPAASAEPAGTADLTATPTLPDAPEPPDAAEPDSADDLAPGS